MSPKYWWTGLLLVVGALNPVFGGDPTEVRGSPGRCAVCGRPGPCQQKVCRIECGVEKIKKYCWCVEAADVCTMLPSHPGRSCDPGCDACGAAEVATWDASPAIPARGLPEFCRAGFTTSVTNGPARFHLRSAAPDPSKNSSRKNTK